MTALSTATRPGTASKTGPRLGVVGLGLRAAWMTQCMLDAEPDARLCTVVDPGGEEAARKRIEKDGLKSEKILDDVRFLDDLDELLRRGDELDGIVLGTRCHLHTPLAIKLLETGIPLFLEKPVAISWAQLAELRAAAEKHDEAKVVVSFPLPRTPLFEAVHAMVRSGRLGTVNQIQAFNNVNYGAVYHDSWYADTSLTGGLWLQKATHDFDYLHRLAPDARPAFVTAMHSRCAWGRDGGEPTLNQDAGSAIVQYDDGSHTAYSQNFITRKTAGARGATLTGEDATVRFDWETKSIRVTDHHTERTEDIRIGTDDSGHGGGDQRLARNFMDVVQGRAASITTLQEGLLSAATCLAARDSAHRRTVEPIPPQDGCPAPMPPDQRIEPAD